VETEATALAEMVRVVEEMARAAVVKVREVEVKAREVAETGPGVVGRGAPPRRGLTAARKRPDPRVAMPAAMRAVAEAQSRGPGAVQAEPPRQV
jgi:hypothetical protein